MKLEFHEDVTRDGARRSETSALAAKQEWIIRRDVLLKNVLSYAAVVGILETKKVNLLLSDADKSDVPLFTFIGIDVLDRLCKGLDLEGAGGGDDNASEGENLEEVQVDVENFYEAMRKEGERRESLEASRQKLLSSALSWALESDEIVKPQEFEDMQFSWTFKDQPYVARRAAWRTVVSVNARYADEAREQVAPSLAHDLHVPSSVSSAESSSLSSSEDRMQRQRGDGEDDFSGNAMTSAAFQITLQDADRIVLELDTSATETQSIEIAPDQLKGMKEVLLRFFKSRGEKKNASWITFEQNGTWMKIRQKDPSSGLTELKFSSRNESGSEGGRSILAQPSDLHSLLDMCDFVSMHRNTLPRHLSMRQEEGTTFDMNEKAIFNRKAGLRKAKGVAKLVAWGAFAVFSAWIVVNRKSPQVQNYAQSFRGVGVTFNTLFVQNYRSQVQKKNLETSKEPEIPASSMKKNKYTTDILCSLLLSIFDTLDTQKVQSKEKLCYQVVMSRSGNLLGVSPANTEAIASWKDLVLVRELYQEHKSVCGRALKMKQQQVEEENTFVLLLTIHGSKVEAKPWDNDRIL